MRKLEMIYNPFTLKFSIKENEEDWNIDSKIYENNGRKKLQYWVESLFETLYDYFNEDFSLTFIGSELDYEDIKLELDIFNLRKNTNIELHSKIKFSIENKLEELKKLFIELKYDSPFNDFKDSQVMSRFNNVFNKEFEIAVIGTVSSGKSTLINALISDNLMPSQNQSCTSKIIRIKDVDSIEGNIVVCRDIANKIVRGEIENADYNTISKLNEEDDIAYIDIQLNIPFIDSDSLHLVLLDTPGPNNSHNEKHSIITYDLIKKKDPLILYVLDFESLDTNDTSLLLQDIATEMEKKGKQSKDRFIFVINKVDTIDMEKQSIADRKDKALAILEKNGIKNPNIYLTSSLSALVAKLFLLNKVDSLTTSEKRCLRYFQEDFNDIDLSEYSTIYKEKYDELSKKLHKAIDENEESLVRSGIVALEMGIHHYLEKYAISDIVKNSIDTFNDYIKEKDIENNIQKSIRDNQALAEALQHKIEKIQEEINNGNKGREFIKTVNELNIEEDIDNKFQDIFSKFQKYTSNDEFIASYFRETNPFNLIAQYFSKITNKEKTSDELISEKKSSNSSNYFDNILERYNDALYNLNIKNKVNNFNISKKDVNKYIESIKKTIENINTKLIVDIKNIKKESIEELYNTLISEYKSYIDLLSKDLNIDDFNLENKSDFFAFHVNNIYDDIHNCSNSLENFEKEKSKFYTTFEQIIHKITSKDIKIGDNNIDISRYNNEVLPTIIENLKKIYEEEKQSALKEAENLKKYFINELAKLNDLLEKKKEIIEHNRRIKNNEIEKSLEEDRIKQEWLSDFSKRLNSIIEL